MLCEGIETTRKKCVKTLGEKLKKVEKIDHLSNQIEWMLNDIKQCLNRSEEAEGYTTQIIVGISNHFRGWIVKKWVNVQNVQPKKISMLNKIIVWHCVSFYAEA